jgi:hypothetical protein
MTKSVDIVCRKRYFQNPCGYIDQEVSTWLRFEKCIHENRNSPCFVDFDNTNVNPTSSTMVKSRRNPGDIVPLGRLVPNPSWRIDQMVRNGSMLLQNIYTISRTHLIFVDLGCRCHGSQRHRQWRNPVDIVPHGRYFQNPCGYIDQVVSQGSMVVKCIHENKNSPCFVD